MATTLTVTETILKRDIGYVPFDKAVRTFEGAEEAQIAFEAAVAIWGAEGAEVLEQEGTTIEFQNGQYHRILIDLS